MVQAEKKVLYLITKATWGGAQRYVFDLATHLPKGFTPIVAYGQPGKLAADLSANGIRTFQHAALRRDVSIASDSASFFEILKTLRSEKPDVLHLNSSKAAGLGALAGRVAGVPKIVFTAHGWPFKENRGFLSRWAMYLASWLTALCSHSVIVVSKEDEILGKNMWIVRKKIKYIPLALCAIEILSRPKAEEKLFQGAGKSFLESGVIRLVTIAELTSNKGVQYGVDMMAELKKRSSRKFKYMIIGDGEERTAIQDYAKKLGVTEDMNFINIMSDQKVDLSTKAAQFLSGFDMYILPSIKEGMPYVLLEAAAAGLPIIATNVVQSGAAHIPNITFVPPRSGAELADAVKKLVENMPAKVSVNTGSFAEMMKQTISMY